MPETSCYLGIDVGSVSTNFVAIDENNEIVKKLYIKTGGDPIKAVIDGLGAFCSNFKTTILGVGATGSGRRLAAAVAGADVIKNEITAHAAAAISINPKVRTIFEIGGQDSKIILIEEGGVCDFAMNTVCAAGTGSFLDRQAARLQIPIEEFGGYALKSASPVHIAGRCAVFAESDMISKQQAGHCNEDIIAGLCETLARNFLNNLAKGKQIVQPVVFQGGVAANVGIVAAFEKTLGMEVIVPPYFDVMGAFGAALLSKRQTLLYRNPTKFIGFDNLHNDYAIKSFECDGCDNMCEVIRIITKGNTVAHFGDRCGKWGVKKSEFG